MKRQASALEGRKGVIISGGPASVHDPGSPAIDPALLRARIPVLGICYGQQLMAHLLGGEVQKGEHGEYGFAELSIASGDSILRGIAPRQQVWMSHFDTVVTAPQGFGVLAGAETCPIAAIADPARGLFAVQFHPEVAHTPCGPAILKNFLFDVCHCERDWDPAGQVRAIEDQIRAAVGGRNVFFFVSGGVDSTVAYTLCLRALGADRVHGAYVDTGLMREGETVLVRENFESLRVEDASAQFLNALKDATDPEQKRHIIGEQFVKVQQRILESEHFLDGHWILGQGTIYPDTIESGGSAKADLIKTHHNRVAGIQTLIEQGRIVEPLASFYKDEVRAIGRELDIRSRPARPASLSRAGPGDPLPVLDRCGRTVQPTTDGFCRCGRWACKGTCARPAGARARKFSGVDGAAARLTNRHRRNEPGDGRGVDRGADG